MVLKPSAKLAAQAWLGRRFKNHLLPTRVDGISWNRDDERPLWTYLTNWLTWKENLPNECSSLGRAAHRSLTPSKFPLPLAQSLSNEALAHLGSQVLVWQMVQPNLHPESVYCQIKFLSNQSLVFYVAWASKAWFDRRFKNHRLPRLAVACMWSGC